MAPRFRVPKCLDDLMELPNDDEDILCAQDVTDIDSLNVSEMQQLVAGTTTELADKDVLCVQEQSLFDKLFSLVRGFAYLEVSQKNILIDSLCTNFVQLNVSASVIINSIDDPDEDHEDITLQCRVHCNAIKIYIYFLSCILIAEEAEPESSGGKSSGKTGGSKKFLQAMELIDEENLNLVEFPFQAKTTAIPECNQLWDTHYNLFLSTPIQRILRQGRPRKKHVLEDWDLSSLRARSLRVLAGALQNDLKKIFESPQLDESLIAVLAKAAFKMLENKSLLEKDECKQPLCTIVSACTIQYGYGISSVVTIIDMLHKFEHLPKHVADLVSFAENQYNGSSLAVDLLRAIGKINPVNFERDNAGAEYVGTFLEELAVRVPKIMVTNLSVILCHLDGKSHKMRNSLVKVIGTLLVEAIKNADGASPNDVTRLRTEQRLLNVLIERSRDISAHTRKHVLQTWACLCKEHAVPIGHWNLVSDLAAGRLQDNGALVRKSALQLLATLLEYNPFGPSLRAAAFEATYEKYSEKLSDMSPRTNSVDEGGDAGQNLEDMELNFSTQLEDDAVLKSSEGAPSTPGGKEACSQLGNNSREAQQPTPPREFSTEIGGLEHTRALVASLESALRFSKCIGSTMDTLAQLLASSTIGDVSCTIQLLILCKKFEVDGAGPCLRKTLPLVFSHEEGIKTAVEEAFKTLYLKGTPTEVASNLINLTLEATLGDIASIEELVSISMSNRDISAGTVSSLWDFFTFNAQGSTADQSRAALTVLCMAAKSTPQILSTRLQNILDIGFGRWAKDDVLLARSACIALQRLPVIDRAGFRRSHKIFSILSNLITLPGLSEAYWYSASEQAINAIYALHPAPESFSSGLLVKLAHSIFPSSQRLASPGLGTEDGDTGQQCYDFSSVSAVAASRFLFVVAHVALKHLVYIESCLKLVRKQRNDNDNVAEESLADVDMAASTDENIAAELGLAASEDAKLDNLAEHAETEIISGDMAKAFLVGAIAPMVSKLCSNSTLMQQNQHLRSSALLALCKLMVIDANFCEKHLQLLFTVAQNSLEDSVRSNCVVALGDLALRFPNLVEPWMEFMYARVHDKSTAVRKNSVLVISHLILNDLIKVKGYISEMAMHLEDEDSRISELVKLFFHELSKKGNNPINNLLPDILSRLSSNPALSQDKFNLIMQFLISTINKNKQMESLVEKFCNRFLGTSGARQWQDIAYCLCQLNYSLSCLKKLSDNFKSYQHALGDTGVVDHFMLLIVKTRKLAAADVKLLLDEMEEKINQCHNERREQEAAMQKAQEHHLRQKEQEEALLAQSLGDLNLGGPASHGTKLETQTEQEANVVNLQKMGPTSTETPTIVTVKEEIIEQNPSIGIQNNVVEDDDDYRTAIDGTSSISVEGEEEADVAVTVDEEENRGAQKVTVNVEYRDSGEVDQADSPISNDQSRLLAQEFSAIRITEVRSSEEDTGGTQPYPYMDLDLESASTRDRPEPASRDNIIRVKQEIEPENGQIQCNVKEIPSQPYPYMDLDLESASTQDLPQSRSSGNTIHVKQEIELENDRIQYNVKEIPSQPYPYMDLDLESASTQDRPESASTVDVKQEVVPENDEIQYNVKENPHAGYRSDHNQMPRSPFVSAPPSLESPQAPRTTMRQRLRKVGVSAEKAMKSFSAVKEEPSPLHERTSGQSRVLQPHNERG